jgi:signal transduction histidine kinase/CheY-like chemotaxis protein
MNPASPRVVRRSESVLDRGRPATTTCASLTNLETTYASAPHGEALLDRQLRYVRVNAFFADLSGCPAADHLGKTPRELASYLGTLLEPLIRAVVKTGQPILGWEQRLSTRDRGTLDVLANFYPVRARNGHIVAVGATVFDVTGRTHEEEERSEILVREQAAHAAAEHANRMKDEFLARVSHELRTPLSSMLMWLHLLRVGGTHSTANALDALDQSARAQLQVIDDLLDVARGLSGKLHIKRESLEPGPIVAAAVKALEPTAEAKSIRLVTAVAADVGRIVGDDGRLQQIVTNLVANAIKFTPVGGRIEVGLDREGDHIHITVCDTGAGMTPEFLPSAFAAFRQADESSTRPHDGLGLGLAIVRQLVELHGGTVQAESAGQDKGATFTVTLPARPVVVELPPRCATRKSASKLSGLRILVVEDDDPARDGLAFLLEGYGARVSTAASVTEALAALEHMWPDVLISDIAMPREDGYALIGKVRALEVERAAAPLPAAALTAHALPEDRARVMDAGFQAHVPKPVTPAALLAVVLELCGRAP